jgi:hypothetical protein
MNRDLTVETCDAFTTICTLMDIPVTPKRAGKFVEDIMAGRELLKAK